jgi:hypothetical protein
MIATMHGTVRALRDKGNDIDLASLRGLVKAMSS